MQVESPTRRALGGARRSSLLWAPLWALLGACGAVAPGVRVNQVGYLPTRAKVGIAPSESSAPLPWQVTDPHGEVVAEGVTEVFGIDGASGQHLHQADFGALQAAGEGYRLRVAGDYSFPFGIGAGLFAQLKYDALRYFYYNRSGIPITLPYAIDFKWTRPPGHLSDAAVACYGEPCPYELGVTGGWYDAGDFGKYVVNGGIATWTLLNLYERTLHLGASVSDFADGRLNIPESGNGVSDLLDEARYELQFLMKMQVPAGQPHEGMVHHKIHDAAWTMLGRTPPSYSENRYLHNPSTAATLNLAAVGAQCARVWERIDPAFSSRCLLSAKRAWNAAQRNPDTFAPELDKSGGGPYDDEDVSDEFYWAAAELYITTGKEALREFLESSPHYLAVPAEVGHEAEKQLSSMTWQSTASLGSISLAVVPESLASEEIAKVRRAVVATADRYLEEMAGQGYRVPFAAGSGGGYPWGSNSFIANNGIILALANDFSGDERYTDGVVAALDYLLGKNAVGISYVTGYGEYAFESPHHRYWAHARSPRIPHPPPGAVAGGPNSKLQDPTSRRMRSGCAPMACYVDHVDAWAVNEVAINWNAPLSWIASFLDEKGQHPERSAAPLAGRDSGASVGKLLTRAFR